MSGDTVFGIPFFVEYPWESTGITDFAGTSPDWNGEYNKAYGHLLRLNVPIVCLPGNHDTYNLEIYNIVVGDWTGLEGHVEQDGAEIWPTVFSPRYFGWDYGDKCHFTCLWSYDKEATNFAFWEKDARNFLSGDGCADLAVFRPTAGLWAVRDHTRCYFGTTGDRPVPGVYDWYGAAITSSPFRSQPAVFRPGNGLWAVRGVTRFYFGNGGDFPVRARFSGGPLDNPAVFRETTEMWAIRGVSRVYFGAVGDLPVTR